VILIIVGISAVSKVIVGEWQEPSGDYFGSVKQLLKMIDWLKLVLPLLK
jgi:hypothetical protein